MNINLILLEFIVNAYIANESSTSIKDLSRQLRPVVWYIYINNILYPNFVTILKTDFIDGIF